MARNRTAERRRERQQRRRRQSVITIAVVVGVLVALVALFIAIANAPADAPIPTAATERYAGIQTGRSDDGFPRLGERRAPVQVTFYCAYDSADCRAFNDAFVPAMIERVQAGNVALAYVPLYSTVGNSQGAARAAVCALEQERFWQMHETLFAWSAQFEPVQAFIHNRIITGVSNLSLDRAAFDSCIVSDRPAQVINPGVTQVNGLINAGQIPIVAIDGVVPTDDNGAKLIDTGAIIAVVDAAIARTVDDDPAATPDTTATPDPDATPLSVNGEAGRAEVERSETAQEQGMGSDSAADATATP